MKPRNYTDEGIILSRRNYKETDRVLSVFSKNHGRTYLIANGVRRPKSRKRGHLEVFNRATLGVAVGKGWNIVTEAEVVDDYKEVKKSLKKVALAYFLAEVIEKTTREEEAHLLIYELLVGTLEKLKKATKLKTLRLEFTEQLLILLGFWPRGKRLVNPDAKLSEVMERDLNSVRVGKILLKD